MAASIYSTLAHTPTTIKEPGIGDFLLFAPLSDFTTIEKPVSGESHIAGDHIFPVDKGFMKLECAPAKEKLSAQFVGEAGNLKLANKLEVFIPGSNKELHKLIGMMKNDKFIILAHDSDCVVASYYQIGNECNGAYLSPTDGWESGTTKDGVKGYKLTFEAPSNKVITYEGVVTMHP